MIKMKKNSNRQSNNVKNSLNKNSKTINNCKRSNDIKNSNHNVGFEEDSKSFSLDENDDHSFELK